MLDNLGVGMKLNLRAETPCSNDEDLIGGFLDPSRDFNPDYSNFMSEDDDLMITPNSLSSVFGSSHLYFGLDELLPYSNTFELVAVSFGCGVVLRVVGFR